MAAIDEIKQHIEAQRSFVLEAGAGSGKTYTLIQTLNYLLDSKREKLAQENRKIACITYTNVAKNEIIERLEHNPLVQVSTIHEFLWSSIKSFNKQLIIELDKLNEEKAIKEPDKYQTGLKDRIIEVTYDDSGYRDFEKGRLEHDDVIVLSNWMYKNYETLSTILAQKYPFILVDEYQDTATETAEALIEYLLEKNSIKLLLGFYGDSHQKIYDHGVGDLQKYIDTDKLVLVKKEENYRSSVEVINLLNRIRTNIQQVIPENKKRVSGSVKFINCINYPAKGPKEKVKDYEERILPIKTNNYQTIIERLKNDQWNFDENGEDKILILVNSKVAEQAGFGNLYQVYNKRFFEPKEELMKRGDIFANLFMGSLDKKTGIERETGVEHLASFYEARDYNKIIHFLKRSALRNKPLFSIHPDKQKISNALDTLINARNIDSVKDIYSLCINNNFIQVSDSITRFEKEIAEDPSTFTDPKDLERYYRKKTFYSDLMNLKYEEIINAFKFIKDQTALSTKHGTKGEEYRNVLVVIDDTSWKTKYNFQNFFNGEEKLPEREIRTRNLFYVSCSRAKENLVVLALSEMEEPAMLKIKSWFGENVEVIS
ncbi:MAG: ATP-dependent helicase [Bacteroidales bacterium]|nr:ATP-dependent helicase [Bacteroidales bacterium]